MCREVITVQCEKDWNPGEGESTSSLSQKKSMGHSKYTEKRFICQSDQLAPLLWACYKAGHHGRHAWPSELLACKKTVL